MNPQNADPQGKAVILESTLIRGGQHHPYGDTVTSYQLTLRPNADDKDIWEEAQKLRPAQHRRDGVNHDGSCGFPFGLDSFGSLNRTMTTKATYTVTEPYCD